jgi:hypothetical protein
VVGELVSVGDDGVGQPDCQGFDEFEEELLEAFVVVLV